MRKGKRGRAGTLLQRVLRLQKSANAIVRSAARLEVEFRRVRVEAETVAGTVARIKEGLGAGDRGLLDGTAGKRRRVSRGSSAEEVGLRERRAEAETAKSQALIEQAARDLKRLRDLREVTARTREEAIRARDCGSAMPLPAPELPTDIAAKDEGGATRD